MSENGVSMAEEADSTPERQPRVLIADDDLDTRIMLSDLLAHHGYEPIVATDGEEALALAAKFPLDLALVDVVMPGMDGLELLDRLRIQFPDLPVILLTAHATLERAVEGFRQGAADFVRKLDGTKALLAAIERALAAGRGPRMLQVKDLTLNLAARRAWRGDEEIPLTRLEFDLLAYLAQNSGRAVSYDELLTGVWEYPPEAGDPAQVRMALSRLRQKLKEEPGRRIILTVRGVGCRIDRE